MSTSIMDEAPRTPVAVRLGGLGLAWLLIVLAGPGMAVPEGLAPLAPLGAAGWAWFASRPGRFAFAIEFLLACIAWCWICSWAALVHWSSLLFIGPGFGLYFAGAGVLLRRLARDWPLAIAAPAAWMAVEALRSVLEPPFGLSWMRLGVNWHAVDWLNGSARIWGVWGISYAVMAAGSGLADLAASWRSQAPHSRRRRRWAIAAGCGPPSLAAALSAWVPAPESELGPRVLLVQPGFEQERKMERGPTRLELFGETRSLTIQGISEAERAGERTIDLVAWGETMLPLLLADPDLEEAIRAGAKPQPWVDWGGEFTPTTVHNMNRQEQNWVHEAMLGSGAARSSVVPAGAVFVSGVLHATAQDGVIGLQNAVALWKPDGSRGRPVSKAHLVPGAETMLGLERFEVVRSTIFALARYVPDLLPHEGSRVLDFTDRTGREYRFGVVVCFDNAYDGPFVTPLHEGPLDFHLVTSNEAWFKDGQEPDQMMAFSRLEAIATGRAIVRATNSGISAVFAPDGAEVARLVVGGRDREVAGTLRADVPVPTAARRAQNTVYVRSWYFWPSLALLWPVLLVAAAHRRRAGYHRGSRG